MEVVVEVKDGMMVVRKEGRNRTDRERKGQDKII